MIEQILLWAAGVTLMGYLACLPFVYFWIVRPYDRLLGDRSLFLERGVIVFSVLVRATNYCGRIHRKPRSNWYDDNLYGDFDFREHATPRQRIISRVFNLCSALFLVVLGLYAVFEYLWPLVR